MFNIPNLGSFNDDCGLVAKTISLDKAFTVNTGNVSSISATKDDKVELIAFDASTLALVNASLGHIAYYPVHSVWKESPTQAILMDLDGTTVNSETFWIDLIQETISELLDNDKFQLEESDLPYVSGHSVSEHLQYCIAKYCPDTALTKAQRTYTHRSRLEMLALTGGNGKLSAFVPAEGLKSFLLEVKSSGIKIGLVTSGLYEKAIPEINTVFTRLGMGNPADFYDTIVTAGFSLASGTIGTLGELSPKPHPWLYAEACSVGLGIPFEHRHSVVGIEDSGAGVCSVRLAGFRVIGMSDGNIDQSGTSALCSYRAKSLHDVLPIIV